LVWPALPCTPTIDVMLTIAPARRFSIGRDSARHVKKAPPRLVSITERQSSSERRMIRSSLVMPALLTRTAIGPMSLSTASTSAAAPSAVDTSPCTAWALPPASRTASQTAFAADASRA
jgi:hypothetical protein